MTNRKQATGMHWLVLVLSAICEAVWALALDESEGFTRLIPTLIFLGFGAISMVGLSYAMRGIAISVAYAIWTGLGAALTVAASMVMGLESPSPLKLLFLAGIVGCVAGLRFVGDGQSTDNSKIETQAAD